jgi:glutamine amidotransferase
VGGVVTVVDYGMGNLLSVRRALEHVGAEPRLTSDPDEVAAAERLVIPGVGAFADGMRELETRGLVEPIRAAAESGRPVLGICLGLHLLMDESEEFGRHEGLGILPGRVVELARHANGTRLKVPHIGWGSIHPPGGPAAEAWRGSPLEPLHDGVDVYFVHSFVVEPADPSLTLAVAQSDGRRFPAALRRGAVSGTQFHPEKSGPAGLAIVAAFAGGPG